MINREFIDDACQRIAPHIRRTPVMLSDGDFCDHDRPVSLKLELFQHTGSFKPRGAFNNLLSRAVPRAGLTAASGGNHGAAVAFAAARLGHRAKIFVPEISSPAKQARIRNAGAELVVAGARYADALARCEAYQQDSGAMAVHAYDAVETIAGQGTLAVEWLDQAGPLDTLLVAVGGGGLISGIVAACGDQCRVVAVEPEGSACLAGALAAGRPVDVEINSVAADSLGAKSLGRLPFQICRHHLSGCLTVPDAAIIAAQRAIWQKFQIVTEAGGATALAALMHGAYRPRPGERVGVLLCGANADLQHLL